MPLEYAASANKLFFSKFHESRTYYLKDIIACLFNIVNSVRMIEHFEQIIVLKKSLIKSKLNGSMIAALVFGRKLIP